MISRFLFLTSLLLAASVSSVSSAQRRAGQATSRGAAVRAVSCEANVLAPNRDALQRLRVLAGTRAPALEALSTCVEHGGRVWGLQLHRLLTRPSRDERDPWASGPVRLVAAELGSQAFIEFELELGGSGERRMGAIKLVDVDGDGKPEALVERTFAGVNGATRTVRTLFGLERGAVTVLAGDAAEVFRTGQGSTLTREALGRVVDVEDTNADGLADRIHVTAGMHTDAPRCGGGPARELIGALYRAKREASGAFVVEGMPAMGPVSTQACEAFSRIRSFRHLDEVTVGRAIVCQRAAGASERDVMFRVAAWCRRFEDRCATETGFEGTGISDTSSATDIVCPAFWQAWAQRTPATRVE